MIEVIPAVMPYSVIELEDAVAEVKGLVPIVQIDVMDGIFVPAKNWPYVPRGAEEFAHFQNEAEGLPFWDEVDYEVDLMVRNPESVVDAWVRAGVSRLIIHVESTQNLEAVFLDLEAKYGSDVVGVPEIGLAINTTTSIDTLAPFLDKVGFVQCMGIAEIGKQGEPFDERVLGQLSSLRAKAPNLILSVDGGVNFDSAPKLIAAGATRLVSGSTIFESEDVEEAIEQLKALA